MSSIITARSVLFSSTPYSRANSRFNDFNPLSEKIAQNRPLTVQDQSESVLSQCSTLVSLRMTNETDQNFVKRALPDSVESLVDALASLRTQEAIVVGEGVSIPVRVFLETLESSCQPHSKNILFSDIWQTDEFDAAFVEKTITFWRRQEHDKDEKKPAKAA